MTERSQVLFIGGRSGVGKTTVAVALFERLSHAGVRHCVIEGDNLDMAHPTPWEARQPIAELNLAAMWRNYAAFGYRRLIYTNTAAVLPEPMSSLTKAMGDDPAVFAVLLQATDEDSEGRLGRRESGDSLRVHIERSRRAAQQLDAVAPDSVMRVNTTDRTPAAVAAEIVDLLGWAPSSPE